MKIITCYESARKDDSSEGISSIDWHFRRHLPWMDDPSSLTVRFENFVGEAHGGEKEQQKAAIRGLGRYLDMNWTNGTLLTERQTWFRRKVPPSGRGKSVAAERSFSKITRLLSKRLPANC